jgi:hypothetical protein
MPQVLLALCCQTCGASLVRRRFLQLKVSWPGSPGERCMA